MAEWVKATEVQLELHRWLTSPQGRRWTHSWILAETRDEPAKGHMYGLLSAAEPQKLLTADSIWVDKEITELIEIAREDFRPEPIEREDFLVHTGFVYFEKPLLLLDRGGRTVSIGGISWCPICFTAKPLGEIQDEGGLLGDTHQGSEIVSHDPQATEDVWGMALTLYSSALSGEDDFRGILQDIRKEHGAPELIPLHYIPITFGEDLDDGHLLDEHGRATGAEQWWTTVQVTLRLMQQRITTRQDERVPRSTRRRFERDGMTPPSEVCVVRLRRTRHRDKAAEEHTGRQLTHRHQRVGHWRNQWYDSVQRHRQIWIHQTIVGDDSLPLVLKRRFYKWDR